MTERAKLEQEFINRQRNPFTMADFIIAWGKLVENCKHEKTHWIQELDSEGSLRNDLVKRCYVCGVNIDSLIGVEEEFTQKLLKSFDDACERKKKTLSKVSDKVWSNKK
jgi:hypothetical protein